MLNEFVNDSRWLRRLTCRKGNVSLNARQIHATTGIGQPVEKVDNIWKCNAWPVPKLNKNIARTTRIFSSIIVSIHCFADWMVSETKIDRQQQCVSVKNYSFQLKMEKVTIITTTKASELRGVKMIAAEQKATADWLGKKRVKKSSVWLKISITLTKLLLFYNDSSMILWLRKTQNHVCIPEHHPLSSPCEKRSWIFWSDRSLAMTPILFW